MADYDGYALPDVNTEQDYARQLAAAELADRKRQQTMAAADRQRQERAARRSGQSSTGDGGVNAAARMAYTKAWQWAEEGIQDFALSFMDFMLISGPAAVAMFVVRFIGGNMMGGSGTITYQGVSVPRIPGYTPLIEGVYKFGKVFLIACISGLIYMTLLFLIVIITNPDIIVKLGFCALFSGIMSFFGNNSCASPT